MQSRIIQILILCFIILVSLPAGPFCDMMWTQEDTIEIEGDTESITQTVYLSQRRFAIQSGDGLKIILDLPAETLTTIDTNNKTYSTVTLAELTAMRERLKEETDTILENALKNIPKAQREEYRKQIELKLDEMNADQALKDPKIYRSSDETKTILGYTARLFRSEDEEMQEELWCAGDIDTSELEFLIRDTKKIKVVQDIGSGFSAIKHGFPLMSVIREGSKTTTSNVTSLSFDRIDSSIFAIPDEYKANTK